jgi:hypothetical protein
MKSYLNFDFGRITITFQYRDRQLVSHLLGGTLESSGLYEGWITDKNPSPCPIGFAIFRYSRILAAFHNLPFYYSRNWEEYINKLTSRAIKEKGCPFAGPMQQQLRDLSDEISAQRLSPFDLSLSFLNMWARTRAAIVQHGQLPASPADKHAGPRSQVENAHNAPTSLRMRKTCFLYIPDRLHSTIISSQDYKAARDAWTQAWTSW